MRVEKITQAGGVAVALGHNTREKETLNADPEKKKNNQVLISETVALGMEKFRGLIAKDEKPRKNAVLCLDYMITATNGSISSKDRTKYINDAIKWVQARHGAENVVQVAFHADEPTDSHVHILVVPLKANKHGKMKLNASNWLDGSKKLSEMQTEFAQNIGAKYDLARGVEGSVAKHERVKRFYGLVNSEEKYPKIAIPQPPKFGILYDMNDWQKRAEAFVLEAIKPDYDIINAKALKLVKVESELSATKKTLYKTVEQNKKLGIENKQLWTANKEYLDVIYDATFEQIQGIRDARNVQKELEMNQQQEKAKNTGMKL